MRTKLPRGAPAVLLLLAAAAARADCHWAWHCEQSGACGFVPFCDRPTDKPPPLRGAMLPGEGKPAPLPPDAYGKRKPLPGFKPVSPPPSTPGMQGTVPGMQGAVPGMQGAVPGAPQAHCTGAAAPAQPPPPAGR